MNLLRQVTNVDFGARGQDDIVLGPRGGQGRVLMVQHVIKPPLHLRLPHLFLLDRNITLEVRLDIVNLKRAIEFF